MLSILLSSTPATITNVPELVGYILGTLILIGAAAYLIYRYKTSPDADLKLQDFFGDLEDIAKTRIIEFIDTCDFGKLLDGEITPEDKKEFADVQAVFFNHVYDDIWKMLEERLEEMHGVDSVLFSLLSKAITKEKVQEYVSTLFTDDTIQEKLIALYNTFIESKAEEITSRDEELSREAEKYEENVDDSNDGEPVKELDPMKLPGVEEEIVPPVEDESDTISADDSSVEIVETEDVEFDDPEDPLSE